MPKYDWENRKYDDGTYTFLWSMPRLDKRKDIYRCVLRGDCLSVKDGKVEITIPHQQYTDAEYQRRIIQKISAAIFAAAQQTTAYSLNTVLFSDNNWETIRKFQRMVNEYCPFLSEHLTRCLRAYSRNVFPRT